VRAAVILVGDELLAGHTRDANAHYIAQRLTSLGHRLRRIVTIPDEIHAIQAEVDVTMGVADLVFISGGLGPTHDDRTTEALAARFGRRLVVDEPSWQRIVDRYAKRVDAAAGAASEDQDARRARVVITDETRAAARKMVTIPEGVEVLENPAGAAPGYVLRAGEAQLVVMPGVPAELQAIFEMSVVGKLLPHADKLTSLEIDVEMAEAAFATPLSEIADRFGDVEIGSYPHYGERRVTLRFKGEGDRPQEALDAFLAKCPEAKARLVRRSG
jgi:molybdenum cofactor synthesis domain-containing protein